MSRFDIDKKGYNVNQVEDYIKTLSIKYEAKLSEQKDRVFSLRNELDVLNARLELYQSKDKQISKALIYAVEKADQIESSARKLYDLEIKRINLLYEKWDELVNLMENEYGDISNNEQIYSLFEEFKRGLESVISQNKIIEKSSIKDELKNNSSNYIKNLLNKMDYVINVKGAKLSKTPKESIDRTVTKEHYKESERLRSISDKLENLSKKSKQSPVIDYLNSDDDIELNNYGKNIARKKKNVKSDIQPDESGFDFNDALNPKEELDEIMKAFDFFNDDASKKRK